MSGTTALRDRWSVYWLPRTLHPFAWWIWALGLAAAASRTTNPILLGLIIVVACSVVLARRGDAPWALAFRLYLIVAALVVFLRVAFRVIFGGGEGSTILFTLPAIPLPAWAAGIRLFGAVSAESLLGGFYDGLRLATMIVCIGAANALANPKRLLAAVPSALYDVGTAVVVALSVFPQLAESVLRVRRARRLRGGSGKGRHALRGIIIPVLEDALERSLMLAAAMDSRGYGRSQAVAPSARLLSGTCTIAGLLGVCAGVYGVLDGTSPAYLGLPMLVLGLGVAAIGFTITGRRVRRTRYRPDRFGLSEWLVAGTGVAVAVLVALALRADPDSINPSLWPLAWPTASLPAIGAVLLGALPMLAVPPTPTTREQLRDALPDEPGRTPERAAADLIRRRTGGPTEPTKEGAEAR